MFAKFFFRSVAMLVVVALLATASNAAEAVIITIDFEDLAVPVGGQINPPEGVAVVSQGFNFAPGPANLATGLGDIHIHHDSNGRGPKNGTNVGGTHSDVVVTNAGGSAFSLFSFDYAGWSQPELNIVVTGTFQGGGTIATTFIPDGVNDGTGPLADFENFSLGTDWVNLQGVTFEDGDSFVLDNITVGTIPEPSTVVLLLTAAIGFLGIVWRRRK